MDHKTAQMKKTKKPHSTAKPAKPDKPAVIRLPKYLYIVLPMKLA